MLKTLILHSITQTLDSFFRIKQYVSGEDCSLTSFYPFKKALLSSYKKEKQSMMIPLDESEYVPCSFFVDANNHMSNLEYTTHSAKAGLSSVL